MANQHYSYKLQQAVLRKSEQIKQIAQEIQQFRIFLQSDKFTGTEVSCQQCGRLRQGREIECQSLIAGRLCGGSLSEVRKDWISTADVDRFLAGLSSLTQE